MGFWFGFVGFGCWLTFCDSRLGTGSEWVQFRVQRSGWSESERTMNRIGKNRETNTNYKQG